ncbi:hypothetical protein [Microcoleus sp. Pol12A5]|uniref:hypothetical protein n=1 Tax=Microcoleus sp. Pol12A5 TaxID=3055392 RepID=UPI002FCEC675
MATEINKATVANHATVAWLANPAKSKADRPATLTFLTGSIDIQEIRAEFNRIRA